MPQFVSSIDDSITLEYAPHEVFDAFSRAGDNITEPPKSKEALYQYFIDALDDYLAVPQFESMHANGYSMRLIKQPMDLGEMEAFLDSPAIRKLTFQIKNSEAAVFFKVRWA